MIIFLDELKNIYFFEDVKDFICLGSLWKLVWGVFIIECYKLLDVVVLENWWWFVECWFLGGLVVWWLVVFGIIECEKVVYLMFGWMNGIILIYGF